MQTNDPSDRPLDGRDITPPRDDAFGTSAIEGMLDALTFGQTHEESLSAGYSIGKYDVRRLLGCHGQATVVLAFDPQLQRHVVLKIYHDADSGEHRNRIINEGRALAQIQAPQIATCYGVEDFQDYWFLVIEFVEGQSLQEYLDEQSPTPQECLNIFKQLVAGVQSVHDVGLLHRDLKPSNVMITFDGQVKLIDFGLVQSIVEEKGDSSGTPAYMAPEHARNESAAIDQRSDIFGLGAILYDMLTGRPPFAAETNEQSRDLARAGSIVPALERDDSIPPVLNEICMSCLQIDPADRFHSTTELAVALDNISRSPRTRNKWLFAAASILVLIVIGALWIWMQKEPANGPLATQEFYADFERLANVRDELNQAFEKQEIELAKQLVDEGARIATRPDLTSLYGTEFLKRRQEVSSWTSASDNDRANISNSIRFVFGDESGPDVAADQDSIEQWVSVAENHVASIKNMFGGDSVMALTAERRLCTLLENRRPSYEASTGNVSRCRKLLGDHAEITMRSRFEHGRLCLITSRNDQATKMFQALISFAEDGQPPVKRFAMHSHRQLAVHLSTMEASIGEAETHYRQAKAIFESLPGNEETEQWWFDYAKLAHCGVGLFARKHDYETAITIGEQALTSVGNLNSSKRVLDLLGGINGYLFLSHSYTGDVDKTRAHIQLALDSFKAANGELSHNYEITLNDAATAMVNLELFEESIEYLHRALEIARRRFDGPCRNSTIIICNLADRHAELADKKKYLHQLDTEFEQAEMQIEDRMRVLILMFDATISMDCDLPQRADERLKKAAGIIGATLGSMQKDALEQKTWESMETDLLQHRQRLKQMRETDLQ